MRWRQRLDLVWNGRGLTINVKDVPDQILDEFIGWVNEKIEEDNQKGTSLFPP
jgi:hypothetical protein